jgi:carbon-monoxide dehydrogenase medium subunit
MGGDPPPALLVLDATVECISPRGKRKIPLTDFFTGYFETCLEPDEIYLGVEIPPPPLGMKSAYLKHTLRSGDLAIVGVAVQLAMKDDFCEEIRIALGGVAPVPFRASQAEALLRQRLLSDHLIGEAAAAAADMSDPISDAHASADYRRSMVQVFVRRALQRTLRGGARELR